MWTRLSALIVKELIAAFRDPRGRIALVVPPLIQMLLFAYAATLEVTNVPVGILNDDWGAASTQLIARFERTPAFSKIHRYRSLAEAQAAIDSQEVMVVVHLGQDFSRMLASGENPRSCCSMDVNPMVPRSSTAILARSSLNSASTTWRAQRSYRKARSSVGPGTIPIASIATRWCRR
jgi:ABC-2 type transport system permease protein